MPVNQPQKPLSTGLRLVIAVLVFVILFCIAAGIFLATLGRRYVKVVSDLSSGPGVVLTNPRWDHGVLVADTYFQELPTDMGTVRVKRVYVDHIECDVDPNAEVPVDDRSKMYTFTFKKYKGSGGTSERFDFYYDVVDKPSDSGSSGVDILIPPKPH